jgi:hypothetical protein
MEKVQKPSNSEKTVFQNLDIFLSSGEKVIQFGDWHKVFLIDPNEQAPPHILIWGSKQIQFLKPVFRSQY